MSEHGFMFRFLLRFDFVELYLDLVGLLALAGTKRNIFSCFACISLAIVVSLQRDIYNNVYEEVRFGLASHLRRATW